MMNPDQIFAEFVLEHEGDDAARLMLSGKCPEGVDLKLAVSTIECRRKLKKKLPEWYGIAALTYPTALSAEQCSSSETAQYKADTILRIAGEGCRVADLTGGLGVDSHAFSKVASAVIYNEINPLLCEAARHNFSLLGAVNITIKNLETSADTLDEILEDPDIIFLDPARRNATGGKVFKIEDCTPDIGTLADELLRRCRYVLVKLSPMADISSVAAALPHVKEVHCVGADGECKELLFLMDSQHAEGCNITVYENGCSLTFAPTDERTAAPVLVTCEELAEGYLLQPTKALSKSGCFNMPCSIYPGIKKLGISTHIYWSRELIDTKLFKTYRIIRALPFSGKTACSLAQEFGKFDVTARNIPANSDELKAKMEKAAKKARSESEFVHIFAVGTESGNMLVVTKPTKNAT